MARSSVAAAMRFWLARGGVFGWLTSKSVLMQSRACLPSSRARSPRAEASPAMEA
jgi:FAD/FMN-containing dehydrogenase